MTIIARHSYSAGASDPKARALQEALAENERLRAWSKAWKAKAKELRAWQEIINNIRDREYGKYRLVVNALQDERDALRARNDRLYDALARCSDVLEGHPIYSNELRTQVKAALKEMDDA